MEFKSRCCHKKEKKEIVIDYAKSLGKLQNL